MPSLPSLQRLLSPLRELNPLWLLAAGILALLAVALSTLRHQVDQSERLQQRLTGTALVDALKAYADATKPGASAHPANIQDLIDDNRSGTHRNWLDAASAESLADRAQWKLVLDADGRLIGAQLNTPSAARGIGLPAWLAGASSDKGDPPTVYAVEAAPPPSDAVPTKVAPLALPQPVLPDTPLAPLEQQAAAERAPNPTPAKVLAAAPGEPRAQAGAVLDADAKPGAKNDTPAKPGQPSRILAGLEARQVLRLSGGDGSDAPVLTPRRAPPPTVPIPPGGRTAAVGAVGVGVTAPAARAPDAKETNTGAPSPSPAAAGPVRAAPLPASTAAGAASTASLAAASTAGAASAASAAPTSPGSPGARAADTNSGASGARTGSKIATARPAASKPAAQGVLKRKPPPPPPPAEPAPVERPEVLPPGHPLASTAGPTVRPATAPPTPSAPAAPSSAPAGAPAASAAATAMPSVAPVNPPAVTPSVTALPPSGASSNGPAGVRMDTVIYEDSAGTSAAPGGEGPKADCRALAGDSAECDTFEDNDPALYQRCYQSLSERINACIAGEPIPSLVTH